MKKLILVPGAHKTGTTYLQKCLGENHGKLIAAGLHMIDRDLFYASALRSYIHQGIYLQEDASLHEAMLSMKELTKNYPDHAQLLFVENIFGEPLYGMWSDKRPTPKLYPFMELCADRFMKAVGESYDVEVAYLIRNQADFLDSLYSECIRNGWYFEKADFLGLLVGCDLSWKRLLDRISVAIGPAYPKVMPFEIIKEGKEGYLRKFSSDVLGIQPDESWQFDGFENRSLSPKVIEIALASFAFVPNELRAPFVSSLESLFAMTDPTKKMSIFGSSREKESLMSIFKDDNQAVLKASICSSSAELNKYY